MRCFLRCKKKSPSLVRGCSALVAPLFCFYVFASLRGDACRGEGMCGGVQFFCFSLFGRWSSWGAFVSLYDVRMGFRIASDGMHGYALSVTN